ncbi:MAG: hypothetical protein U9M98_02900 [Patescibacteria group bacterium]|nr:hypothetical protein [Patescibacteria group bacterium]
MKKPSLPFIGFLQALGVFFYCGLVALFFWKGNEVFGVAPNYLGPLLVLLLFVLSALICALIVLGYPIKLFWEKGEPKSALRLVAYSAAWVFFFLIFLLALLLFV